MKKTLSGDSFRNQVQWYESLGDAASDFAKIDKKNAEDRIKNIKKQISSQKDILKQFDQFNSFQKLIRPDARNAQNEIDRLNELLSTQEGRLKAANVQLGFVKVNENI